MVAAIPLIFGAAQTRNFDLLKTLYLRGIVTVVVCAAIVEFALASNRTGDHPDAVPRRRWWRTPEAAALAAALFVLGSTALATSVSIVPRISMVGSHIRNDGLFTEAANVGLFLVVAWRLRRLAQLERLLDAAIATALVASVHGMGQALGVDPLSAVYVWVGGQLTGTFGNPLFFGGYLTVVILLTAGRLGQIVRRERSTGPVGDGFRVLLAGVITLVPFVVVLVIGASHPSPWWLMPAVPLGALLVLSIPRLRPPTGWQQRQDVAVFGTLLMLELVCLLLTRARSAWIAVAAGALVFALVASRNPRVRLSVGAGATVVLLIVGLALGAAVRGSPLAALPGVGQVLAVTGQRFSVEGRIAIWSDVLALVSAGGAGVVDGDRDVSLRSLVGHGPGTLYLTSERFQSERRFQLEPARIDRAHNEVLDRLATRGVLGLVSWVALLGTLATLAVRAIRAGRRRDQPWMAAALVGSLAGVAINDLFGPGDETSRMHFWLLAGIFASGVLVRPVEEMATEATEQLATATTGGRRSMPRRPASDEAALPRGSDARAPLAAGIGLALLMAGVVVVLGLLPPPDWYVGLLLLASLLLICGLAASAWLVGGIGRLEAIELARPVDAVVAAALVVGAVLLLARNARPAEADLFNKAALLAASEGLAPEAVELGRRAVELSPNEELYYMVIGGALADMAPALPDRGSGLPAPPSSDLALRFPLGGFSRLSRADVLGLAQAAFERARDLNPYDLVHYENLAKLAERRAAFGDPNGREQALAYWITAQRLSPSNKVVAQEISRLARG